MGLYMCNVFNVFFVDYVCAYRCFKDIHCFMAGVTRVLQIQFFILFFWWVLVVCE